MLENELATQKPKILATLVEVVTTLPEKYSIYSTLAGLLNAKNYNFGGEVSLLWWSWDMIQVIIYPRTNNVENYFYLLNSLWKHWWNHLKSFFEIWIGEIASTLYDSLATWSTAMLFLQLHCSNCTTVLWKVQLILLFRRFVWKMRRWFS